MRLFNRAVASIMGFFPEPLIGPLVYRLVAKNYVAGPTIKDAVKRVKIINARGADATIDHLGEEVKKEAEVAETIKIYSDLLKTIRRENLRASISIKPTNFGLCLNRDLCFLSMREVVAAAAADNIFTWIDMEDSSTTFATVDFYLKAQREFGDLVGVALQAYLKNTAANADLIMARARSVPHIRLCKGIYNESPRVAFKAMTFINFWYDTILEKLLSKGSYVGIATHDPARIDTALRLLQRYKTPSEFQMLLGVENPALYDLINDGYRGTVYVPFGVRWYAYSMRRLKENPRIVGYILKNMFSAGKQV